MNGVRLAAGALLGALIAGLALAAGLLTRGGAAAAGLIGAATFGFGGLGPAGLLLVFFLTSSLFSRVGRAVKQALAGRMAKDSQRDAAQVFANGSVPALLAIGYGLTGAPGWLAGIGGALAAANADTWATEIGVLARRPPRLITNWKQVEPGTSGAISPTGSLATLGGSLLIAGVAGWVAILTELSRAGAAVPFVAGVWVGGVIGAFADSLLGATLQASYRCSGCGQLTERHPLHTCGSTTELVRGWAWLGNDLVNLVASVTGAGVAWWVWNGLVGTAG